jgi:hypothetical protein
VNEALESNPRLRKRHSYSQTGDRLYQCSFIHHSGAKKDYQARGDDLSSLVPRSPRDKYEDDPIIHYGLTVSADQLLRLVILEKV